VLALQWELTLSYRRCSQLRQRVLSLEIAVECPHLPIGVTPGQGCEELGSLSLREALLPPGHQATGSIQRVFLVVPVPERGALRAPANLIAWKWSTVTVTSERTAEMPRR
jgi:hypothetical protein